MMLIVIMILGFQLLMDPPSLLKILKKILHFLALIIQEIKIELQHQVQTTQYQISTSIAMLDLMVVQIYHHFNMMINLTPLLIEEFEEDMEI